MDGRNTRNGREIQEAKQSVERRKVGGKLTEQEESIEWFEKVFDDIEIEDAKIKRRGDKMEKVDELDEIEIMRESIEARCEKQEMSGFERVKVLVEIIEDAWHWKIN